MSRSRPAAGVIARAGSFAGERDSDARLVEMVKAGNLAAFDRLVHKYKERLYAILYNMTANREDAADLTQEAFIKAFRSIHRFKGNSRFFTWLYRIGINTAITQIKRNRLRRFFSFDRLDEDGAPVDLLDSLASGARTERPVLLRELQEKLNEALQRLSPKHRTVVILYEIEGLSHEEIATVAGCSVGTVRSRLHYAKKELQGLLSAYLA